MSVAFLGVAGAMSAQAQTESLRSAKRSMLDIRMARITPASGFDAMTIDRSKTIYVASRGSLSSDMIESARSIAVRGGSDVELSLTQKAADRLSNSMSKYGVDHLAVFVAGKFQSYGPVTLDGRNATISNVTSTQADRLTSLVNLTTTITGGPAIKLVASQIAIPGDGTVRVDVFLAGDADGLRAYQVNLAIKGGDAGQLIVEDVVIEKNRADFVFVGQQQLDAADKAGWRLASALFAGTVDAKSGYLGSFMIRASADAAGTFELSAITDAGASTLIDRDNKPIPFATRPISITVGTRAVTPTRR